MKKIDNSTKIFAFLGLVVVTVVVWQAVLASRVVYDLHKWKKAASVAELTSILERDSKSYRKVPTGAFSQIAVQNGVYVQVIKSDNYGVYQSDYSRAQVKIREEAGVLYISEKDGTYHSWSTPVFVLMPREPEISFSSRQRIQDATAEICGFDRLHTKISLDSTFLRLRTDLAHLDIEVINGSLDYMTGSRYFAPTEATDVTVLAKHAHIRLSDSLSKRVHIDMNLERSSVDLFVHRQAHIGSINIKGSVAPYDPYADDRWLKKAMRVLATIDSQARCDSLLMNIHSDGEERHEVVVSEGFKASYEEINLEGKIDLIRREIESTRQYWPY